MSEELKKPHDYSYHFNDFDRLCLIVLMITLTIIGLRYVGVLHG